MKRAYFITATGTNLGKTWVAAGVAQACRARGMAVRALKPVMSGYDEAHSDSSDAGQLLQKVGRPLAAEGAPRSGGAEQRPAAVARHGPRDEPPPEGGGWTASGMRDAELRSAAAASASTVASPQAGPLLHASASPGGTAVEVAMISPWRFAAPLSPDRAAALEGRGIDFAELLGWCREEIERNAGLLLIEGIGGVMVPFDARHTVRDWIAALDVPTVLVAGTYLGALSHTLTALAALREVGVVPAVIVVNESADSPVGVEDAIASLAPHVGGIALIILRRDDAAGLARLADSLTKDPG